MGDAMDGSPALSALRCGEEKDQTGESKRGKGETQHAIQSQLLASEVPFHLPLLCGSGAIKAPSAGED